MVYKGPFNNMHINGPNDMATVANSIASLTSRSNRTNTQHYSSQANASQNQMSIVENGVDFRHSSLGGSNTSSNRLVL